MGKPLQIRDVPEDVHDALRERARRKGLSLAAYALQVLSQDARTPTVEEVLERACARGGVPLTSRDLLDDLDAEREANG